MRTLRTGVTPRSPMRGPGTWRSLRPATIERKSFSAKGTSSHTAASSSTAASTSEE